MKDHSHNIAEIVREVKEGDESAFRRIYDYFYPNLYTTIYRLTKDEALTEDVIQDTFLKVWIERESLEADNNISGFIFTIARNFCFNTLKKQSNYKVYLLEEAREELIKAYPQADNSLISKEFDAVLNDALAKLPPKQREAFRLIKEENMKRDEAASILNVSPETIKSNLDLAMKSVRLYVSKYLNDMPLPIILYLFSKNI